MGSENYKEIKQVLWTILFANLGVALLKIIIGSFIKSTSMTADGFHSLTDGASNIIGLIGIGLASKPVDEDHPYGHRKFETLAELCIAAMLFFIGGKIIFEAAGRFINPVNPQITTESLIALIVTLIINILVSKYEYSRGKRLKSYILMSDSLHTKCDIYVSIGVLITLVCVRLGLPSIIDPIASIVVSGFVLYTGYEIFKSTVGILVDRVAIDKDRVKEVIMEFDQVKDVHNIRSRGSERDIHIDMHILTEPGMSVEESHRLIHDIERSMKGEINESVQVNIHIEPFYDSKHVEM